MCIGISDREWREAATSVQEGWTEATRRWEEQGIRLWNSVREPRPCSHSNPDFFRTVRSILVTNV